MHGQPFRIFANAQRPRALVRPGQPRTRRLETVVPHDAALVGPSATPARGLSTETPTETPGMPPGTPTETPTETRFGISTGMQVQTPSTETPTDAPTTETAPHGPIAQSPDAPRTSAPARADVPAETAQRIVEILTAAPAFGETIVAAYHNKERELAALFRSLARPEAMALHRRFADPRDDDALAGHFGRLVIERRVRLLAVLARR